MERNMTRHTRAHFPVETLASHRSVRAMIWLNLLLQLATPVMMSWSGSAVARSYKVSVPSGDQATSLPELGVLGKGNETSDTGRTLAGLASGAGQQMGAGHGSSQAAGAWVSGVVSQQATREVQHWLSRYGTTRVRLGTDSHFSLKNVDADLLTPVWEAEDVLYYTQGGVHRADDRTQTSIGFGGRWFTPTAMWGSSLFLDNDLTQHHARYGLGGEYWQDYLKLSANAYRRLTDWKGKSSLEGYEARVANGWDVRAEGYLPAMPSLGMKMTWEQYYGDEVALFDKDHRQQNPHALTAGLNWTPFPLLTLEGERRQGANIHDSRIGMTLRWQPGVPMSSQLDGQEVVFRRSLAGSRHDLVDRNSNIVLEYRKKHIIRLSLVPQVSGYPGDIRSLGVQVSADNGFDHISWDSSDFEARGGQLIPQGKDQYSVVLPPIQPGGESANTYILRATAWDQKGNASEPAQSVVVVQEVAVDSGKSTFAVDPHQIPVDGTSLLTFMPMDANGRPLTGSTDMRFVVKPVDAAAGHTAYSLTTVTEIRPGVYTATLTGLVSGELQVAPAIGNTVMNTLTETVTVIGNNGSAMPDVQHSTITPAPVSIPVSTTSTLTLTVRDENNNPVPGLTNITQTLSGPGAVGSTVGPWTDNGNGTYTATLTGGTTVGDVTVMPQSNGANLTAAGATVTLTAAQADKTHSSITPVPTSIPVTTTSMLTLTVKDEHNNPVPGLMNITQTLSGPGAVGSTVGPWTDNGNGTYTATLTGGTTAGDVTVMPQSNGANLTAAGATVTLLPDVVSPLTSEVRPDTAKTEVGQKVGIVYTAKDRYGNAIKGLTGIGQKLMGSAAQGSNLTTWTESTPGTYNARLTGSQTPGDVEVMPQLNNSDIANSPASVSFTPGAVDPAKSVVVADDSVLPASGSTRLTLTAQDRYGNLVPGQVVTSALQGPAHVGSGVEPDPWTDNGDGTYSATLTVGNDLGYLDVYPVVAGHHATDNPASVTVH
ncbi:inverse autotransporter beta domain-containing protein [Serratia marcescens]|nr:inverse autotransporter beta domain-containing protein [Serratia marcescens]MBH3063767.1 inverse autotransporter beta domain-containing protein [Serratia marcescens]